MEREWYQTGKKGKFESDRLTSEVEKIGKIFAAGRLTTLKLPHSTFDDSEFVLHTKEHYFSRNLARRISAERYSLGVYARFSLLKSSHICPATQEWRMIVLYPRHYPNGEGVIDVAYAHLPNQENYQTGSRDHVLSDLQEFGMGKFFRPCYWDHNGNSNLGNADSSADEHIYQALLWLRARLYADRTGNFQMPEYTNGKIT